MPTQRTIDVYTYEELSDYAKEKARDWYRRGAADDSFWSEHLLGDEVPAVLKACGYVGAKIYYSGFSSQGDGACFVGTWYSSDFDATKLADYVHGKELGPIITRLAEFTKTNPGSSASLTHRWHYYDEMSVSIDWEPSDDEDCENSCADDAAETFTDISRDLMRWLYSSLEAEYEYQNSDEQVADNIIINGYEFDAEGDRI